MADESSAGASKLAVSQAASEHWKPTLVRSPQDGRGLPGSKIESGRGAERVAHSIRRQWFQLCALRTFALIIFLGGVATLILGANYDRRLALLGYALMVLATVITGTRPFRRRVSWRLARRSSRVIHNLRASRRRRRLVIYGSSRRGRRRQRLGGSSAS